MKDKSCSKTVQIDFFTFTFNNKCKFYEKINKIYSNHIGSFILKL